MKSLTGTGALVRLGLRRDRIMVCGWLLVLAGFALTTASSYTKLYDTEAARAEFAAGINDNPSSRAIYGPVLDDSIGGLAAWRVGTVGAVLVAVLSILLVIRHTRADEESGRLELVGSGVVGRYAPLTAGLLIAAGTDLALALLVGLGLAGQDAGGAFALGLGWLAAGLVFAAVAAVAAQFTESARSARGIAFGVLGAAFLVRAAGDAGRTDWLSWLSPIGWTQQVRAFAGDRWWVLLVPLACAALVTGAAYALLDRRDLGAGLLPPRLGPAQAAPALRSPFALAWRLQRGTLLAWLAGFAVYGAAIGGMADGIADMVDDSEGTRDLLIKMGGQQGIVDAFLAAALGVMGMIASVYAVQAALRLRGEETDQRAETILVTPVGHVRWAVSHLAVAALGSAALLVVAGLAIGLVHGLAIGDLGDTLPELLSGALIQVPAAWLLAGIAVALFGVAPRLAQASWGVLGLCFLLGQLGPVLELDQAVMDLSPFTHLPKLPGSEVTATPLLALLTVAAVFCAAGLAGLRRRDITA